MFKRGDIVVLPFPFTDLSGVKQRPVLIISNNQYNDSTEDIVVCGITSNLQDTKYSFVIDNTSLLEGKIPVTSRVKIGKIFTLKQSLVKKRVAVLKPEIIDKVKNEIKCLLTT